jgi:hypothetical protein
LASSTRLDHGAQRLAGLAPLRPQIEDHRHDGGELRDLLEGRVGHIEYEIGYIDGLPGSGSVIDAVARPARLAGLGRLPARCEVAQIDSAARDPLGDLLTHTQFLTPTSSLVTPSSWIFDPSVLLGTKNSS